MARKGRVWWWCFTFTWNNQQTHCHLLGCAFVSFSVNVHCSTVEIEYMSEWKKIVLHYHKLLKVNVAVSVRYSMCCTAAHLFKKMSCVVGVHYNSILINRCTNRQKQQTFNNNVSFRLSKWSLVIKLSYNVMYVGKAY